MNQKGFATLEIILMVLVIGILATMAVPQFEKVTASANTAKVQTDLATINTAIAIYQMEKGTIPTYKELTSTSVNYFENGIPQLPSGKIYVVTTGNTPSLTDIDGSWEYDIKGGKATFGSYTIDKFRMK